MLVLVVAMRPQQGEQAVPALPQFGHLSRRNAGVRPGPYGWYLDDYQAAAG